MVSSKKKVLLTLVSSISVQMCNVLIALIVPRILIEVYGSDTNGIVAAARQFSQYLALMETSITAATCYLFIDFKKKEQYDRINDLFVTIGNFYKKIGVIIAGIAVVLAVFYAFTSKTNVNIVTIIILFSLYESIYVISYLVFYKYNFILFANGKQYFIAFATVISTITAAVFKCVFAVCRLHILILISAGVVVDVIRLLVIRHKVKKEYPYLNKQKAHEDISLLKQKWDSLIMSISDSVKSMIPILCISIGYGSQFVSVFSVYQTVMHLGTSIITMCANGLLPVLGIKLVDNDKEASDSFRKITVTVLGIGAIISTCFCGMILNFIKLYIGSGADISYEYPVLGLLLITNTWMMMARAPYDLLIKAHGKIRELRNGCLIEISITVILCIVMSLFKHFELIVIGIVVSSFYRVIRMLVFCVRKLHILPLKVALTDFSFWLIFSLVMGGVFFYFIPQTVGAIAFIKYTIIEFVIILFITILMCMFFYRKILFSFFGLIKKKRT